LIVLLAGPAFSVLFGMFILASCFMVSGETMPMQTPVIPEVSAIPPAPAFHAGVQKGDRILSIDGERITTFYQVILKIRDSAGQPHKFVLERKGKPFETTITPYLPIQKTPVLDSDLEPTGELKRQGIIGIQRPTVFRRLAFGEALRESVRFPVMTVVNLLGVVKQPSTAKDSIGGPGTMIMATSDAVDEGSDATLRVAALISISLGIMNLLPIFPLDGGQIVVALAEMLRGGRRLSLQVQNLVGVLGIGLVLLIMASALFVDFGRIRDKPVEPQQANTLPPEPKHGTKATPPTKPTLVQPTKPRVL
jgi:regulator of sigma E protease